MTNKIYFCDNLPVLQSFPAESVDLIYIDPPFSTGKTQARTQIKTERSESAAVWIIYLNEGLLLPVSFTIVGQKVSGNLFTIAVQ